LKFLNLSFDKKAKKQHTLCSKTHPIGIFEKRCTWAIKKMSTLLRFGCESITEFLTPLEVQATRDGGVLRIFIFVLRESK
jgi:hypothetical protein